MKKFFLAVALIAFGNTAFAADVFSAKDAPYSRGVITSAPNSATSWSGIWGAALAGYSMSNTELGLDARFQRDALDELAGLDGFGGEGFDATVQLGGDVQLGRFVVGGWGEYSFGGTESQFRVFGNALTVEQQDSYGVFARAGVPFGDTLFYGAGGYVWTEAEARVTGGFSETFDFSGPAAEIGVEHRFGPNVRGKLSARYTWLDSETLASEVDDESGDTLARLTAEPGVWSVKAGVVLSTSGF